jgi:hypothetical protein
MKSHPFSLFLLCGAFALMQGAEVPRSGRNFLATTVYSQQEEEEEDLLKSFEGLRVADVTDGMDAVGLQKRGAYEPVDPPALARHQGVQAPF